MPYRIKLVRDRVDEIGPPRAMGYRPTRDRAEHVELLRQKLGEEVIEYLLDPSEGELADILEVISALCKVDLGTQVTELIEIARGKREERGGFEHGLVMETRGGD